MEARPVSSHPLRRYGWRDDLPAAEWLDRQRPEGRLARVVEQHRSGYRVTEGGDDFAVGSPSAWTRRNIDPEARAAVGDWVLLDPVHDQILQLLPRSALLSRGAAGEHYQRQLIAANVDTVLVVCGLDGDFSPRRLERYVMLVRASGSEPVVVLTKRDLCADLESRLAELSAIEGQGIAIVALNARELASRESLEKWTLPGRTLVLVGSSGAGKSTLTNALLGIERQKTGAVRETDSRGRHTTTHRALIPLPGGACLVDTPGMRELKLTGDEDLAEGGFEDIEKLAGECRFRDCRHDREPGCAVRAALESGALDAGRLAQYFKLHGELAEAGQAQAAQRAKRQGDRVQTRALHKRLDDKYGQH
ncbi:ribosome small subunit-dependent GTPase A [Pseudomarimonas salicorniae]|uniref:Small ribosomal subunit biogenesis GTPase RsgA n=1 Tax=Pseudomarimonas salicorniae TaxID=2933270 RepID=A0ABT0GIK5_9GAMM|nr:ribosome small subunit-dependent GTPase A [Lysobacter sp. CAU 1642]MCK7594382.1 ribosome small subunit-dependent GTPase A [Lysobacter sp. CAU 1642]